jgi:hypothetical protein
MFRKVEWRHARAFQADGRAIIVEVGGARPLADSCLTPEGRLSIPKVRAFVDFVVPRSATMPTSAMYFALAGSAICESDPEKIAAVAESAATTKWREETKDRKRHQRQQHGVKSGDHGGSRDAGIAQHLRDIHRREGHAGHGIAHGAAAAEGPKAAKKA